MQSEQKKIWGLPVRLFHWTLVMSFVTSYLTGEEESWVHVYSGYLIIGLLIFRIIYGFIGSRYARFSDFLYGPSKVWVYAKSMLAGKVEHVDGHNPLGGLMVIALLISLTLTTLTGLKVYGLEGHGPLADTGSISLVSTAHASAPEKEGAETEYGEGHAENEEEEEFWEEIHEFLANFTVCLVLLHILGVVVSSRLEKQNLVKAMVTGYKDISHPNT